MSDMQPFEAGKSGIEVPADDRVVFTAPMDGFDGLAYGQREEALAAIANDPSATGALIAEYQQQDPAVGIMVNNVHNRVVTGPDVPRLCAKLAIFSGSTLDIGLPALDFRGGVAVETKFRKDATGADFTDSVMPRVDFSGRDLRGVSFVNAIVNGGDFTDAKLDGVDFTGAYLIDVHGFTEEQLEKVVLDGARVPLVPEKATGSKDIESALSSHFGAMVAKDRLGRVDPVPMALEGGQVPLLQSNKSFKGLYGVKVVLNDVDFTRSKLHGMTLKEIVGRGIILRGAFASGGVVTNSILDGADMHSFWAPGMIWEDVSLRGADVTN
ncbi:pentapeptide repeat-containing protein, partial [Candidatus Saccharibacteria bacterium]|nr:pentapeptide repeat-containing protein [Candidatus Saccharibacteria bacterium]